MTGELVRRRDVEPGDGVKLSDSALSSPVSVDAVVLLQTEGSFISQTTTTVTTCQIVELKAVFISVCMC